MSILIVEDNPERIRAFRENFIGVSTSILTDAFMAISWLKNHTPHLILLDYDLDEFGRDRKTVGTGLDVAKHIAKFAKRFQRTLIIVHSLNNQGAKKIIEKLKNHGLIASRHPHLWKEPLNMDRLADEVKQRG